MIISPKYVYAHLPKTGGTWVSQVLHESGVPLIDRDSHMMPEDFLGALPDRLSFTFVRHPVTWWRSFWAFSYANGKWPASREPFDRIAQCCLWYDYREFMAKVLNDIPGEYSRIVARWTKGVTRVGRFESLAADLTSILAEAGSPLTGPLPPPANVGEYDERTMSTPEIDAEIMRTEHEVIATFYGG